MMGGVDFLGPSLRSRKRAWALPDWKTAGFAAFGVWLLVVGAHHEPWFDESQAWLLARDSSLYELLAERVRYEGSPGLWHFLLWIGAHSGIPFSNLYLISAACALSGAAIVLWRAPFPAPLRLLLLGSYFFSYQFSVVARSYTLDLALIPALALVFPCRTRKPIIYGLLLGLLANSNAHSFFFASVLGAEWLWSLARAQRINGAAAGLALAFTLGLFALFVAWQPADNAFMNAGIRARSASTAGLLYVNEAFVDRWSFWSADTPSLPARVYGAVGSACLLLPSLLLFRRAGTLPLFIALVMVLTGFSIMVYAMPWHSGILFLAWIFCLWIAWPVLGGFPALGRAVMATLTIVTAIQMVEGVRSGVWDALHSYTGSAQAAKRITDVLTAHPQARIAAAGFMATEVQPYFSHNIFSNFHEGALQPAFVEWKHSDAHIFATLPEAHEAITSRHDLLLMSTAHVDPEALAGFESAAIGRGYRILATCVGNRTWKGYADPNGAGSLIIFISSRLFTAAG